MASIQGPRNAARMAATSPHPDRCSDQPTQVTAIVEKSLSFQCDNKLFGNLTSRLHLKATADPQRKSREKIPCGEALSTRFLQLKKGEGVLATGYNDAG